MTRPTASTTDHARSNTADEILDLAETLIQARGCNAFSYQDIADKLGIRKASIHYHFPSKSDLGISVIERYTGRCGAALEEIARDPQKSSMVMLDQYVRTLCCLRRHAGQSVFERRARR
jgi:TetR/AcrR family transcriptional repressor of nem operon